jgi:hypothetical protein
MGIWRLARYTTHRPTHHAPAADGRIHPRSPRGWHPPLRLRGNKHTHTHFLSRTGFILSRRRVRIAKTRQTTTPSPTGSRPPRSRMGKRDVENEEQAVADGWHGDPNPHPPLWVPPNLCASHCLQVTSMLPFTFCTSICLSVPQCVTPLVCATQSHPEDEGRRGWWARRISHCAHIDNGTRFQLGGRCCTGWWCV